MNLKKRIQSGERVLGTMVTTFDTPDLAKILKVCGFDFFIIDCEHGSFSYDGCSRMIGVARSIGLPAIVRIPGPLREPALKFMEMGAADLLLPNTECAEDARKLVDFTKYAPMGRRGVSLSRPHTDFMKVDGRAYMERANEETLLFCQIESRAGVERVEEILAVEGIDIAFMGPNDLSQDYGLLGQYGHPEIVAAFERVIRAAKDAGKASGTHFGGMEPLARWIKAGMTVNMCSSDIGLMQMGAKSMRAWLDEHTKQ